MIVFIRIHVSRWSRVFVSFRLSRVSSLFELDPKWHDGTSVRNGSSEAVSSGYVYQCEAMLRVLERYLFNHE